MTALLQLFIPPVRRAKQMLKKIAATTLLILTAVLPALRAPAQDNPQKQDNPHPKIHPWVWQHTENGNQAEFFIVMAEQADLSYSE
jgi:hypothetical protein